MRSLARWGSLPLLAVPLGSWALSPGDIEANSFLNQPLNAAIPFTATEQELATLSVSMAPASEFLANGLEYPAFLSSVEFNVSRDASGRNVVRLSSRQAIAEPFVTMRIVFSHSRGSFTREYSVFLDPPLFRSDQAAEPIAAPFTREAAPDITRAPIERPAPAQPQPQPQPQPAAQQPAPPASPASSQSAPPQDAPLAAGGDYTVLAGDTLWAIANRYRPAGVSTNQAMISIFEANPAAFDANINRMRRGAILRIPPAAELGAIVTATANAEVQRQIDAWRNQIESSPQLVLLPPSESAPASGAASAATGAADSQSSERIGALQGEVADLESDLASTEAELAEARRLLELRDAELANLQNQLDSRVTEPASGALLDEEQLFVDEDPVAEAASAEPEAAEALPVESTPEAESAQAEPAAAEPAEVAPARTPAAAQTAELSLVDRALEWVMNPIVAIGGGVLVVLIAALAFLRRRRDEAEDVTGQWDALEAEIDGEADVAATARMRARAKEPDMVVVEGLPGGDTSEEPDLSGTAQIEALGTGHDFDFSDTGTAEVEALLDPGDFSDMADREPRRADQTLSSQTLSSQTVINLDQADPIAEADFHMAYGLYDQAADLISKALKADPDDRALKLKLLEVYFVWGNKEQFLEAAKSLRADRSGGDWDKVVIMGKQICPDDPLFADATAAAGEVDLDLAGSGESAGLDFAFEEDESEDVDLDFGLVDTGELAIAQSGAGRAPRRPTAPRDDDDILDIGARTQAGLEAALLEDMDDEGERTTPGGDIGDLDVTMESPTVSTETRAFSEELTLEGPTVENLGPDAPTVETPTIETAAADDAGDTVEHMRPDHGIDMTAEIEIDDLGLEIGDLEGVPSELGDSGTVEQSDFGADADDNTLSATGVTQVLDDPDIELTHTGTAILDDDDATMMAPGFDSEATGTSTAVLEQSKKSYNPEPLSSEDDLDLNLEDFSSALEGGDTAEQPMASRFGSDLDLDIGFDVPADDEPTGTEGIALDPQTMTEVGTKLDLARAYIDMGDPEGAKSILEEVLSEGDAGQRSEAQALIDALPAA